MYVPPFDAILANIGLTPEAFKNTETVRIPVSLFKFLMQFVLIDSEFNEDSYLAANADVARAVERGDIEDVRLHYLGNGYFEGRPCCGPEVDEQWYARIYPDVAKAIKSGAVASADAHFNSTGAAELRAPASDYEADAVQWGIAFGKR